MTVHLVALKCLQCGFALPAEPDEVVCACPQCGQAARLEADSLVAQPVTWAEPRAGVTPARWLPFWAFPGRVVITRRETQGFSFQAALSGAEGADPLWQQATRLWVPAFGLSLDLAKNWGALLTRTQPALRPGPAPQGVPLRGCVVALDDARKLAEFVVLSIEAERPDMLSLIEFTLPDGTPELWVLPSDGSQLVTG
jgi:hypothetical protein